MIVLTFYKENMTIIYISMIPSAILLFPTLIAVFRINRDIISKETDLLFKPFFKNVLSEVKSKWYYGILIVLLYIILGNSLVVFYNLINENIVNLFGFYITIAFIIGILFGVLHMPLVMAYFKKLTPWQYIKLAFVFAYKDLVASILILAIIGITIVLFVLNPYLVMSVSLSIPLFLISKLTYRFYMKLYVKHELNKD